MVYLTRHEHFNAAHKLYNDKWDEAKNFKVFGKCANKNWHGHNYELFVTVKGEVNAETGFVVNLKDLGDLIQKDALDLMWTELNFEIVIEYHREKYVFVHAKLPEDTFTQVINKSHGEINNKNEKC